MKTSFAALALLAGAAFAAPLQRRAPSTVIVYETVSVVNTVWVNQAGAPVKTDIGKIPTSKPTPEPTPETTTAEPTAEPTVEAEEEEVEEPVVEEVVAAEQSPEPTPEPTPTPEPVVEAQAQVKKPKAPKTTATPEPVPEPTPEPIPEPVEPEEPKAPSSPSSNVYTGDITYYDAGMGSCGLTNSNADYIVAIAAVDMGYSANPNLNPNCGRKITIEYEGRTHDATVVDTCPECASGSIDLTPTLFQAVAPKGDGRVKGVNWWFTS